MKIYYFTNGATLQSGISNPTLSVTELPNPLPTASLSGYEFYGWFLDANFTTPATAGATISADTVLYAKLVEVTSTYSELFHGTVTENADGTISINIK